MMSLGMSREEFWDGDISATWDYIEAQRYRDKKQNENAWLNGMYTYNALSVMCANLFSKNASNKYEYPNEPYKLYLTEKETEIERKKQEEQSAERAKMQLELLVNKFKNIGGGTSG